jgi:hypothetical protein
MHDRTSTICGFAAIAAYGVAAGLFVLILGRHETMVSAPIQIDAPPAAVWKTLSDTARYPDWNPLIRHVDGELRQREAVEVTVALLESGEYTSPARVMVANPDGELRWRGAWLHPDLLTIEEYIEFDRAPGGTKLNHTARFSGLLAGSFSAGLFERAQGAIQAMNRALKERAEAHPKG